MPLVNYCKKCKAEVPDAGVCLRCGGKLTKAGQRLSFTVERNPVRDWFAWNAMLRVVVPVFALVLLSTVAAEALTEGAAGVRAVFIQGFFWTLLTAFGAVALFTLLILLLQGRETSRYALDGKGAHAVTCLRSPKPFRLYARLLGLQAVGTLREEAPEACGDGLTPVKRADLAWADARRAQFWSETHTILLYHPKWWQAMRLSCGESEYATVEAYVRGKVSYGVRRKKRKCKK
jgi:hypothetical protein